MSLHILNVYFDTHYRELIFQALTGWLNMGVGV